MLINNTPKFTKNDSPVTSFTKYTDRARMFSNINELESKSSSILNL